MNRATLPVLPALLAFLVFTGCKKNTGPNASREAETLIASAQAYFNAQVLPGKASTASNPRTAAAKITDWSQAQVVQLSNGPAVFVPVHYKNPFPVMTSFSGDRFFDINDQVHLLIYRDMGSVFHTRVVSAFPDSGSKAGSGFRGLVLVDNWDGSAVARYRFDGGPVQVYRPVSAPAAQVSQNRVAPAIWIQANTTCTIITGVNTVAGDPSATTYWEEEIGCSTDIDSGGDGANLSGSQLIILPTGPAGRSGTSRGYEFTIFRGNNPIKNIADYIKCLTNNPNSTYKVTLYVDQPTPGSRVPYSIFGTGLVPSSGSSGVGSSADGSGINAGHTFLQFQQTTGSQTITRAMGLYPGANVTPFNPAANGSLNDDEGHQYNISLTVTLTGDQFMKMINFSSQGNTTVYDLNLNNCTTWAINSLAAGGININTKQGVWPFGQGDDPGDLGEDIRGMTLSSNMSVNTSGGLATSNSGTCN